MKSLRNEKIDLQLARITNLSLFYTTVLIALIQLVRLGSKSESWDKTTFLGCALIGLYFAIHIFRKRNATKLSKAIPVITALLFAFGIFGIEHHDPINGVDLSPILWLGFGPWVLLVTLALLPFIYSLYQWTALPKLVRYSLSGLATLVALAMIPAAWQGGASIIDTYHSEYVINENLAVAAGHLPYVDFIPQYGTLFACLIAPFKSTLSADGLVTLSLYLMSIAAIVAVMIGIYLVYKGTNKLSLTLAILIVVPITSIAQFPNREVFSGTIFALTGGIPTRIFPGTLIAVLYLFAFDFKTTQSKLRTVSFYSALFLAGLNIWHSLVFGMALLLTVSLICILMERRIKYLLIQFAVIILGLVTYPIAGVVFSFSINYSWLGIFVKGFGTGFGAEPIITPGPVLVILPLIATIAAISTGLLLKERFSSFQIPSHLKRALVTSSFFSLWSAAGFAYYLNRSYASGQMQILFLPVSIALGNFIYFIMQYEADSGWTVKSFFNPQTWRKARLGQSLSYLTLAIVMALPLASTIAFPQPRIELKRLTQSVDNHTWPKLEHNSFASDMESINSLNLTRLGYFGTSGNYYELKFRVPSINLFNSPFDMTISPVIVEAACKRINDSAMKYVVVNDEGLAISQAFGSKKLCDKYEVEGSISPRVLIRK